MISKTEWVNCIIEAVKCGVTEEELATLAKAIYIVFKYMPDNKQNTCTDRPIFHEVVFEDRESAEKILEKMRYSVNLRGSISINEYYELTSVDSKMLKVNDIYGWDANDVLIHARIQVSKGGYSIILPTVHYIKNGVLRKSGRYPWRS